MRSAGALVSLLLAALWCGDGAAATRQAASCNRADVQNAINGASDGDVVVVPPGTCTWTSTVTMNKGITLQGSGIDVTIVKNGVSGSELISLPTVNGKSYRITGFTFQAGGGTNGSRGMIHPDGNGKSWRFDHCKVEDINSAIRTQGHTYGVIDHNTFLRCDMCIRISHGGWNGRDMGDGSWADGLYSGTEKAIYIEDNTFHNVYSAGVPDAAFDCEEGGRLVFRYNDATNQFLINHGTDSSGRLRSCFSMEVYNNTLHMTYPNGWFTSMQYRGGTAVVFNNTVTGTYGYFADLYNRRQESPWGTCDGAKNWDGNQQANGYPCIDQVGRSTGSLFTDLSQPWPNQALEPMYFWNNTFNGSTNTRIDGDGWVVANRDFYNNKARPNYTPYVYPHPLVSQAIQKPRNLRILP